jgi:mono/diheme cytochrome c family protein
MNAFSDLLLAGPIPHSWLQALLFAGFSLHLFFALLALGTALLAVYYFIEGWWRRRADEIRWDKQILRTFMVHKSLAAVLGVAPLLLIQLGHTLPFFNAVGVLAPFWMLLIVFLMFSSVSFDSLGHKMEVHRITHLVFGTIALGFFFCVPAVFVAIMVAAENSAKWPEILLQGFRLRGALAWHWFFRTLHVLAAGVILGALFHYFFTAGNDTKKKKRLLRWAAAGTLSQIGIGPLLTLSLPRPTDSITMAFLVLGLAGLAVFIWLIFLSGRRAPLLQIRSVVPLFLVILLPMLMVRQRQQDLGFSGLEKAALANSAKLAPLLAPFQSAALARYQQEIRTSGDEAEAAFRESCAFCHGENGDGAGQEAGNLLIPPENIAGIRLSRPYLFKILSSGVPGTGMPYFSIFVREKLEKLIDFLNQHWGVIGTPPLQPSVPAADLNRAEDVYRQVCASCHGQDGRPTPSARAFEPPPPDFTQYSLLPQRADEVISNGYRGTLMSGFKAIIPPEIRMALIQVLYSKRHS